MSLTLSRSRGHRSLKMLLALALVLASSFAASGVAQAAPPGHPGFHQCSTRMFASHGSVTYTGTVYNSSPGSVMQYYVRTHNVNVLGWYGGVNVGGNYDSFWVPPFGSHWTYSPAIFPANRYQRAFRYTVTVSPGSDASALGIEIWAPACA